jgi:copper chaperone NosL
MRFLALILLAALTLAGCKNETVEAPPPPHELTAAAIGRYCGMNIAEHSGPKAQIILASQDEPVWFSSARDAFAFTMLPEEPKDIRAIYASDMAKAPTWEKPGERNWVNAKQAFFVIGSKMKGGMGADETVPFSDKPAAEKFAAENGGRVVRFADMPSDYVLGEGGTASAQTETPPASPDGAEHGHSPAHTDASEPKHSH